MYAWIRSKFVVRISKADTILTATNTQSKHTHTHTLALHLEFFENNEVTTVFTSFTAQKLCNCLYSVEFVNSFCQQNYTEFISNSMHFLICAHTHIRWNVWRRFFSFYLLCIFYLLLFSNRVGNAINFFLKTNILFIPLLSAKVLNSSHMHASIVLRLDGTRTTPNSYIMIMTWVGFVSDSFIILHTPYQIITQKKKQFENRKDGDFGHSYVTFVTQINQCRYEKEQINVFLVHEKINILFHKRNNERKKSTRKKNNLSFFFAP